MLLKHIVVMLLVATSFRAVQADQVLSNVRLTNTIFTTVNPGVPAELVPATFTINDCIYTGGASLNSGNHRVQVKLLTKKCGDTVTNISGVLLDIDGKAGLRADCTDAYRNSIGNMVCVKGNAVEGRLLTIIEYAN